MSSNLLKFNADKTEFIWLSTRQQLLKLTQQSLNISDGEFSANQQGSSPRSPIRRWTNYDSWCQPHRQWLLLPAPTAAQCAALSTIRCPVGSLTAFISSRLVYCNATLYGVAASNVCRLQVTSHDECCFSTSTCHWYRQIRACCTSSLRHSTLATSPPGDYFQDYRVGVPLRPWHLSCLLQRCLHDVSSYTRTHQPASCWSCRPPGAIY